jgi:hypothetical protein
MVTRYEDDITKPLYHWEPIYSDIPKNPLGINIFGRNENNTTFSRNVVYDEFSPPYKMFNTYSKRHTLNNDYDSRYTLINAENKLTWEAVSNQPNNGGKPIIPYYYFNQFPFRYEKLDNNSIGSMTESYNLIKYTDADSGARPMLSVNTDIVNSAETNQGTLIITYKVFSENGESDLNSIITVNISVTYEVRRCHMNYMGINIPANRWGYYAIDGKLHINGSDVDNGGNVTEYQSFHSDFTNLQTIINTLPDNDERKTVYNAMKGYL